MSQAASVGGQTGRRRLYNSEFELGKTKLTVTIFPWALTLIPSHTFSQPKSFTILKWVILWAWVFLLLLFYISLKVFYLGGLWGHFLQASNIVICKGQIGRGWLYSVLQVQNDSEKDENRERNVPESAGVPPLHRNPSQEPRQKIYSAPWTTLPSPAGGPSLMTDY